MRLKMITTMTTCAPPKHAWEIQMKAFLTPTNGEVAVPLHKVKKLGNNGMTYLVKNARS